MAACRDSPRGTNARAARRTAGPAPSANPGRTRASTALRSASSRVTSDSGTAASSEARERACATSPVGAMSQPPNASSPTPTRGRGESSGRSVTSPPPPASWRAMVRAPSTTVDARLPCAPISQTPTFAISLSEKGSKQDRFDSRLLEHGKDQGAVPVESCFPLDQRLNLVRGQGRHEPIPLLVAEAREKLAKPPAGSDLRHEALAPAHLVPRQPRGAEVVGCQRFDQGLRRELCRQEAIEDAAAAHGLRQPSRIPDGHDAVGVALRHGRNREEPS